MSLPSLYHWYSTFQRSHVLSQSIAWSVPQKAGFTPQSGVKDWCRVFTNSDTWLSVSCVPLSSSSTHVHVLATSTNDASAKRWAEEIMRQIRESKMVLFD